MTETQPAYMEMVDFIAHGATSRQVAEKAELDHYVELEHILHMAKIRAREILAGAR